MFIWAAEDLAVTVTAMAMEEITDTEVLAVEEALVIIAMADSMVMADTAGIMAATIDIMVDIVEDTVVLVDASRHKEISRSQDSIFSSQDSIITNSSINTSDRVFAHQACGQDKKGGGKKKGRKFLSSSLHFFS